MEIILVIGQTEPDDTLDSMKKHGLEFNVVSSDTNAEDAFTEVVVNVIDVENFIKSYSIDDNLADMLVVPASLGLGKTVFPVKEITKHLETNLFVTSKITGCKYGIGKTSNGFEVIIQGISNTGI